MLSLKEAVSLRACNSETCSWWQPATPFMRVFMQCSPVGCLLRPYLAAHGSPSVLAAIQEICSWARGSILRRDKRVPVNEFPNGSTLKDAQESFDDEEVSMTGSKHAMNLSSSWCSVMAQQLMQRAVFVGPDPVQTSIQSFAESIPSVLEWKVCGFKTSLAKLELEGGYELAYNEGDEFKVAVTTADDTVELNLEIASDRAHDEEHCCETSELSCTGTVHGKSMHFFRYSCNSFESDHPAISGDLTALNLLGRSLLGREVDPATLLHVLWRLLCAPMLVWPYRTPKDSMSCKFSHVAAEVDGDEDPECTPSLLGARNLFEIVASHISVQEDDITPEEVRELGRVSVSKSPFDEKTYLDQISSSLAALAGEGSDDGSEEGSSEGSDQRHGEGSEEGSNEGSDDGCEGSEEGLDSASET
eukprot:Skav217341  [mRNA]  locus=scaffold1410:206284:207534:- [translate_table: standard]